MVYRPFVCFAVISLFHLHAAVFANPVGEQVRRGNATFQRDGNTLTINQSSDRLVTNWQAFSIGKGETTRFVQPAKTSSALNRVTGGTRSLLDGRLEANGQVILVNPNGITVGKEGVVNVNSFIGTTLDIDDDAYMAGGALNFKGESEADIVNLGTITAVEGDVHLVAKTVTNEGTIEAANGTVGLAGATDVVIQPDGDEKLFIQSGSKTGGSVSHKGAIRAKTAEIKAAGNPYALAINLEGVVEATGKGASRALVKVDAGAGNIRVAKTATVKAKNDDGSGGKIAVGVIGGGDVDVEGYLDARGDVGIGGEISLRGQSVRLAPSSVLDASGAASGGILDTQADLTLVASGSMFLNGPGGKGGTANLLGQSVTLGSTAIVDASGVEGGSVNIGGGFQGQNPSLRNALNTTMEAGSIVKADGSIKGGSVIVWSDGTTIFNGTVSALGGGFVETSGKIFVVGGSVNTSGGTWLIDPTNYEVGTVDGPNSISAATLATQLASNNVTIQTAAAGTEVGDITVVNPVTWTSNRGLTLSAHRNVVVNASLTGGGSSTLRLRADNAGIGIGTVIIDPAALLTADGGVTVFYNPDDNTIGGTNTGAGTTVNPVSYSNPPPSFIVNAGPDTTITPIMLVNTVFDLQNIQNNLRGKYALGRDIDASSTRDWNMGAGFAPLGDQEGLSPFRGSLLGGGHVITGLFINRPTETRASLFASTSGFIDHVGLESVSITGGAGPMTNSAALASLNTLQGKITRSYSTGTVLGGSVGGLVGDNFATIDRSYSAASVQGTGLVGGLASTNSGMISRSYSIGPVEGLIGVGGLIGLNGGIVSESYSSGVVTGPEAGGLIGTNSGMVERSYWDVDVSGQASSDGGTGLSTEETLQQASFVSWDFTNDWFQIEGSTRPILVAEYSTTIRNAHQLQLIARDLSASYILANDLNLAGTSNPSDIWAACSCSSGGFFPLGSATSPFSGTFNGNGKKIVNLNIDRPSESSVGLFSWNAGTIHSVDVTGVIDGSFEVGDVTAVLVGTNSLEGTVSQSSAFGLVSGFSVGGLVGDNFGSVVESQARVFIEADGFAGGLAATNFGSIRNSYSLGTVMGGDGATLGGLTGVNGGMIRDSFSAAIVVDGFVAGGLVGAGDFGTVERGFWDTEASGQATSGGGVGLTTAEFQDTEGFIARSGWDFEQVFAPSSPGFYPDLYRLSPVAWVRTPNGTSTYGSVPPPPAASTLFGGPSLYLFGPSGDSITTPAVTSTATAASPVGAYPFTGPDEVESALGESYRIVYSGSIGVLPAPLTVRANDVSRPQGVGNPPFSATFSGFVLDQGPGVLGGVLQFGGNAASAAPGAAPGLYTITPFGLTSQNYRITFVNGQLTVTAAPPVNPPQPTAPSPQDPAPFILTALENNRIPVRNWAFILEGGPIVNGPGRNFRSAARGRGNLFAVRLGFAYGVGFRAFASSFAPGERADFIGSNFSNVVVSGLSRQSPAPQP